MKIPFLSRGMAIALAMLAAGCGTTPTPRYFVLEPVREAGPARTDLAVVVAPVTIPERVDRPQFVLDRGANEVVVDDLHRWASPLQESVADIVSSNLAAQLGSERVATSRQGGDGGDYRVELAVVDFDSRLGERAHLEASWSVRRADGSTRTGRSEVSEAAEGRDHAALAAAHSRALARMSAQIAQAIRALALEPPRTAAR